MSTRGIAIIGCGNIAPAHLEGYANLSSISEVRALCDLYTDKAKRLEERFNLGGCTVTDDYHTLLSRDDIDVVSLCLPPSMHCQAAVDFLDAGKHVIVEKPMAPSLYGCDLMIEAQERSGKILSVISQNRFRVAPMRVKAMMDGGLFGRLLMARVNSMWWRGDNYYDLWWRGTYEKEGGGCTLNHAVHQIDILQWLVGMPTSVLSVMGNVAHTNSEVEDISMSILRYDRMLAQVNSSLVDHDEKQEFFFAAEQASFSIPWSVQAVEQLPNGFFTPNPQREADLDAHYASIAQLQREGHTAQLEDVLAAIEEGRSPLVDGHQGRRAVELITAMYKSSTEGGEVALPLATDDPFYTTEGMLARMVRYHKKLRSVENLEDSDITLGTM